MSATDENQVFKVIKINPNKSFTIEIFANTTGYVKKIYYDRTLLKKSKNSSKRDMEPSAAGGSVKHVYEFRARKKLSLHSTTHIIVVSDRLFTQETKWSTVEVYKIILKDCSLKLK
jgi:predicted secreted protein